MNFYLFLLAFYSVRIGLFQYPHFLAQQPRNEKLNISDWKNTTSETIYLKVRIKMIGKH